MSSTHTHARSESLPNVPTESCGLLREGAPFPPDPPSKNWRPDYSVSFIRTHTHILIFRKSESLPYCHTQQGKAIRKISPYHVFQHNFPSRVSCYVSLSSRISSRKDLGLRRRSAATSTAPLPRRRRTAMRSWSATPTSSATLCAGNLELHSVNFSC